MFFQHFSVDRNRELCVLKNVCEPPKLTISVYAVVPKHVSLTLMCHLGQLHFVISGLGITGLPWEGGQSWDFNFAQWQHDSCLCMLLNIF